MTELNNTIEGLQLGSLLGFVVRRKLSLFGDTIRDDERELYSIVGVIHREVHGKRRRGRPNANNSMTPHSGNI